MNPFPLKFSLICGICKISDFYQRFLSFLFRSIYIIASTDFPKQRSICFETFSPQFHFLLSLLATIEKFIACPIRGDMECGLSDCRGLRSYRLHSLIMRTRCLTRSKRSHVPVCSTPAPRLTRSNRNIPVRGRYGKFGIALLDSGRRFWIVDRGTEQWRKQEGTGIPAEQFLHHCANWAGKQIIDGGGGGGGVVD